MTTPLKPPRSAQDLLQVARDAATRLCNALRCPSCASPFGDCPMQSLVCGHSLCEKCAESARNSLSACPVETCRMPVRPVDLCADRTVRDISAAAIALRAAVETSSTTTRLSVAPSSRSHVTHDNVICVSDSDKDGEDDEDDDDDDAISPTPPPDMLVCMTGIEPSRRISAQRVLREMGAVTVDLQRGQCANVLLTHLDKRREFSVRTRAVHYALAMNVPIVDVTWLDACAVRESWVPLAPFLAVRPPPSVDPVFQHVAMAVDCGCERPGGTEILSADVRNWVRLAGAIVVDGSIDSVQCPDDTRLFVHVVPDLRRETGDIVLPGLVDNCKQRGIENIVRDVAWVSDCLVSRACPPAMGVLAETMADTMDDDVSVF